MHTSILIIVFDPLLAAIIAGLGNRAIGNVPAKAVTTGSLFLSALLSWPIFISFLSGHGEQSVVPVLHWISSGSFSVDWALKIDQLITVSRELAEVQTQLEQYSTTKANLRRRIDTELLTIRLSLPRQAFDAAQTPVLDALRDFGTTLREAFAMVIRFIATILPWLIFIVPGLVLVRWFWRRIGYWLNRREQRVV